jgi:hypothetical protein
VDHDPAVVDAIRDAIQALLDAEGDGWTLAQHVIVSGLERIENGRIVTTYWCWTPPGQADWMTTGLLEEVVASREIVADTDY